MHSSILDGRCIDPLIKGAVQHATHHGHANSVLNEVRSWRWKQRWKTKMLLKVITVSTLGQVMSNSGQFVTPEGIKVSATNNHKHVDILKILIQQVIVKDVAEVIQVTLGQCDEMIPVAVMKEAVRLL